MKKLILSLLFAVAVLGGTATFVMAGNGYYSIVESCWGPIRHADGSISYTPGGRYTMACLPNGNQSCAQEQCLGDIR